MKRSTLFFLVFLVVLFMMLLRTPGLDHYLSDPDHGFQLSLGNAILEGSFPFVDFFMHQGPLISFTSSIGLALTHNLVGVTAICLLGYVLSITLLCNIITRWTTYLLGWLSIPIAFVFMARFYKWYYWLWPLLFLWIVSKLFDTEVSKKSSSAVRDREIRYFRWLGIIAGFGTLYRTEFSAVFFLLIVSLLLTGIKSNSTEKMQPGLLIRGKDSLLKLTNFILFMAIPIVSWVMILLIKGGYQGVRDYFVGTVYGTRDTVIYWHTNYPTFNISDPTSLSSSLTILLFIVIPVTYLFGLVSGISIIRADDSPFRRSFGRTLVICSLFGILLLPQAFYRPDVQHFLQVFPPLLILILFMLYSAWVYSRFKTARFQSVIAAVTTIYLFIVAFPLLGVSTQGATDLASPSHGLTCRIASLTSYPPEDKRLMFRLPGSLSERAAEIGRVVAELRTKTDPDQHILVIGYAPQIYFFSQRPMSGIVNLYTEYGYFVSQEWRNRTLEHIELHPPVVVAKQRYLSRPKHKVKFRNTHPELAEYLEKNFTVELFTDKNWILLSRPGSGSHKPALTQQKAQSITVSSN